MKSKLGIPPYAYPITIVLVGKTIKGKLNFTPLSDVGLMGIDPSLVFISSRREHHLNAWNKCPAARLP